MQTDSISERVGEMYATVALLQRFSNDSLWAERREVPGICDFTFGNPHDMPLPGYVTALQKAIVPRNKDWFAYKRSEPEAQAVVSAALSERLGHTFEADDICLTNGAIAGLNVAINTIVEPGDEIIFMRPYWFLYEGTIIGAGGKAVKIDVDPTSFDLDLVAIKAALSPRTRAIIINSPHNPTGKIYGRETLVELGRMLDEASLTNGRTVFLISDEAYHQIIFDGRKFTSPATIYANTLLVYTYGKVHLTPGQRVGFIALPPQMPNRDAMRQAIAAMQIFSGWAFPNAVLQHAISELVGLSIDIEPLQARRDRFIAALGDIGYQTNRPEGTFYLLVKSPVADDWAFIEQLAEYDVFCMPGVTFGLPGYFRISLTANDQMVERAIPKFAAAFRAAA